VLCCLTSLPQLTISQIHDTYMPTNDHQHRTELQYPARVLIRTRTNSPTQTCTRESHHREPPSTQGECRRHLQLYAPWSTGSIVPQPVESHKHCPRSKQNRCHHPAAQTVPSDNSPQLLISSQPRKRLRADRTHLGHPQRQATQRYRKLSSTFSTILQPPTPLPC
jgi:hypothetical protein